MSPGNGVNALSPSISRGADRWLRLPWAVALLALIAVADYSSGYEVRLSILYLVPIAMATWAAGIRAGVALSVAATLCWVASFHSHHLYDDDLFYFWEAGILLSGFLVLVWVLSELRRALAQADDRFTRVLENMSSAVLVAAEQEERVLYTNSAARELLGAPGAILPGGFLSSLIAEAPDVTGESAGGPPPQEDARVVRHAASGRWFLWQRQSLPWGDRSDVRLHVLTDISAQKAAEQLRGQHSLLLQRAAQLATSSEIATSLAHEINQPLMVIATYTDACQRLLGNPAPDLAEVAGVMRKCHAQAVRAATIIDRLRDFIRGRQHQPAVGDLLSILREALDLLRPRFESAGVSVDTHQVAPGILVLVDRVLVQQILINLIQNALDAMAGIPPARRKLELWTDTPEDGRVGLQIADGGIGLPDEVRERMFEPFFSTKPDGLGLGLAICRSVAEAQGGSLDAGNRPEGGTVVRLVLPLVGRP